MDVFLKSIEKLDGILWCVLKH